jgi:hypothetical protein
MMSKAEDYTFSGCSCWDCRPGRTKAINLFLEEVDDIPPGSIVFFTVSMLGSIPIYRWRRPDGELGPEISLSRKI